MKTTWDLGLFYKGLDDPKIEQDQKKTDAAVASFARARRKDKSYLKKPSALAKALIEYEKLLTLPGARAGYYAYYRKDLDVEDKSAEALLAKLQDRGTKRSNQLLFFTLGLGKISAPLQKKFLAAKELLPYRYWLTLLFKNAKYDLSESEEKILLLTSDVAYSRWIQATENVLNKMTIQFDGESIPLPQAQNILRTLPTEKRRALGYELNTAYAAAGDIAESELNAVYTDKKVDDELRKIKEPYEATIRGYQNDVKSVLALVDAVTEHNKIAHRFYDAKRKMLKLDTLTYADRSAAVGEVSEQIPFERTCALVREEFATLNPRYAEIFDRLLDNGQIDVYPKKGKSGGAYCSGAIGQPTMVLLNHTNDVETLKTLAHEMGHAIHAERAKAQRPLYQGHPISTAETASTFFERVALKRVIAELPQEQQIIALHDAIQDDISTIFRQIAFFRFELELHHEVRANGYVPKERIAELMNEHMAAYLGNAFQLAPEDGYFFVAISHIRRFFYVYSYAYGQLISKALHRKLEKNPAFIEKVDGFLTSGESRSPYDIFKSCGLDTRKPGVFAEGLKSVETDVARFEKLVAQAA